MYKLFLTLRYLTRKKIVIFPILAVWLCVMMMIIVTSIMGGFVDRAQQVNRDLNSDIIISSPSLAGWPHYEELAANLQKQFPDIVDWSPVVHGFGLLNVPGRGASRGIQLVGVDPVGRAKVTRFRESLFHQYQSPLQAADDLTAIGLPKTGAQLFQTAKDAYTQAYEQAKPINEQHDDDLPKPAPNYWVLAGMIAVIPLALWILGRKNRRTVWSGVSAFFIFLLGAAVVLLIVFWPIIFPAAPSLLQDARERADLKIERAFRTARFAGNLDPAKSYATRQQILDIILPKAPTFAVPADAIAENGGPDSTPKDGCYLGADMLYIRDSRGSFHRDLSFDYPNVILTVVPISQHGSVQTNLTSQHQFVVVDDFYSGVIDVDKQNVYASFDIVQDMAGMKGTDPDLAKQDPANAIPARCNEILIKFKPGATSQQLTDAQIRITTAVNAFLNDHHDIYALNVDTWEQQQKTYLGAVKNEKVMITFILLLMSGVVLVVIFLIFYMIVRDKTRDIGIIKAVGGSEEGVAQIFLSYGLFVGLVGGILGVLSGVSFVHHTNQIHDLIFQFTGITIWDRKVYIFDRIPDTVHPNEVALYFGLALAAGFLGALIPALVAGSEDPVKAVRYE